MLPSSARDEANETRVCTSRRHEMREQAEGYIAEGVPAWEIGTAEITSSRPARKCGTTVAREPDAWCKL
jgi:hypothetical protein